MSKEEIVAKLRERFCSLYSCEQLIENDENKELVKSFECAVNLELEKHIKKFAWKQDLLNQKKHYVVKDKYGNIIFYFSLRCGSLFERIQESDIKIYSRMTELDEAYEKKDYAKMQRISQEIGVDVNYVVLRLDRLNEKADSYNREMSATSESEIPYRVWQSMSSVEMVEFCANSALKGDWEKQEFPLSLGAAVFWFLVIPIIESIQSLAGCEFVYLFAADVSEDLTLCSYYSNDLGFRYIDELTVLKPFYDFSCQPMYLDVKHVKELIIERISYLIENSSEKSEETNY